MDRDRDRDANATPRRSSMARSGAPHTPAELNVVSKVGVSVTTQGSEAKGILCLKLAIPRDAAGASWALFSGPTPKLRAIPAMYPLPVPPFLSRARSNLRTATSLLNLPRKGAYPPSADPGLTPRIETSENGQVYVVAEESPRRGGAARSSGGPSTPSFSGRRDSMSLGLRDRAEFLVIIEFQVPVVTTNRGATPHEQYSMSIPVPKCLDNSVRLELLGDGEASVIAEPKILPGPTHRRESMGGGGSGNLFQNSSKSNSTSPLRRRHLEDGWEDGEVPGAESEESSADEDACWLEGRFPSTDTLKIIWHFEPSLNSPPGLSIVPRWDSKCPTISVAFEAGIPARERHVGLEAVLPPGWGWRDLEIRGEGLLSWRSTDEDLASAEMEPDAGTFGVGDDSISTEMATSPSPRSPTATRVVPLDASRLEPLNADELAPLDDADFSFNDAGSFQLSSASIKMPQTPSRKRRVKEDKDTARAALFKVSPRVPVPAGLFELEYEPLPAAVDSDDEDDDEPRRVLAVHGTLVPLPLVLVSPDVPVSIPFIRFDKLQLPELQPQCTVICANGTFSDHLDLHSGQETPEQNAKPRLCSTDTECIGMFTWTDDAGNAVSRRATLPVTGPVRVVVQRNIWGVQTVLAALNWPPRAAEVILTFAIPSVRVIKATSQNTSLAHAVLPLENNTGAEIRVAGGRGTLELVLEAADDTTVALPSLPDAKGELKVELAGDGWDKSLPSKPETNLTQVSERGFIGDLSSPVPPLITFSLSPAKTPLVERLRRTFVSERIIVVFFLAWFCVSLITKVEKLRTEVAFVADEARDLRMYSFERERERQKEWERERLQFRDLWESWEREERERSSAAKDKKEPARERPREPPREPEPAPEQRDPASEPHREREDRREQDASRDYNDYDDYDYSRELRDWRDRDVDDDTPRRKTAVGTPSEHGLGRVVFGSAWPAWTNHPVVRTITSTMGHFWRAVRWLLMPG